MFPFTNEELIKPVNMSIESIRHIFLRDGGDISIEKINVPKVYVRLHGACIGCKSSNITLKNAVEVALRRDIHPDIEVIQVQ